MRISHKGLSPNAGCFSLASTIRRRKGGVAFLNGRKPFSMACLIILSLSPQCFGSASEPADSPAILTESPLSPIAGEQRSLHSVFQMDKGAPYMLENLADQRSLILFLPEPGADKASFIDMNNLEAWRFTIRKSDSAVSVALPTIAGKQELVLYTNEWLSLAWFDKNTVRLRCFSLPPEAQSIDFAPLFDQANDELIVFSRGKVLIGDISSERIRYRQISIPGSCYERLSENRNLANAFKASTNLRFHRVVKERGTQTAHIVVDGVEGFPTVIEAAGDGGLTAEKRVAKTGSYLLKSIAYESICWNATERIPAITALYARPDHRRPETKDQERVGRSPESEMREIASPTLRPVADMSLTRRLLWPNPTHEEEQGWFPDYRRFQLDINGDGISDEIEYDSRLAPCGPITDVRYAVSLPAEGGKAEGRLAEVNYMDFAESGIADLNGDGAMDLIFLLAETDLYTMARLAESSRLVKFHYVYWLFDKDKNRYDLGHRSSFCSKQLLAPLLRLKSEWNDSTKIACKRNIEYADIDGDGFADAILGITRKRLAFMFNTKDKLRPFGSESPLVLDMPVFDGYTILKTGRREVVMTHSEDDGRALAIYVGPNR